MRALTWQGPTKVSVETVADPRIIEPTDAIVRVTSTAICGSDLHLYGPLAPFLDRGDILGHEAMGIVEEVGSDVSGLVVGDRVVVPFNISCGTCWMCARGLQSQCETTQVRTEGRGAALFGYTRLYGQVPGGQADLLRVPFAGYGPIVVPHDDEPDERYLYLSDILPTAWQAVVHADVEPGGTVVVLGLGPVGQLAARAALARGAGRVIGVDLVAERRAMAQRHGVETLDPGRRPSPADVAAAVAELTGGRGADGVIDAVGMESHGQAPLAAVQAAVAHLPTAIADPLARRAGVDRLTALQTAIAAARRGATIAVSGVYGGAVDPLPLATIFDKQLTLRTGQCNVRRWTDELMPFVTDPADPLGLLDLRTHRISLEDAPWGYETFRNKDDECIKVVLDPSMPARSEAATGAGR